MAPEVREPTPEESGTRPAYEAPEVTYLGTLAELTQQKEVGLADGETFLGIDIGS